jgi:hypothetical protein
MAAPAAGTMARRQDTAVKVDAEVIRKAKIVAAYKDVSLAEYLSEALRPIVDRDLVDYSRRSLEGEAKAPKGKDATPKK